MMDDAFDRLRAIVLAEPVVQDDLLNIRDLDVFAQRLAAIADEGGIAFSAADVEEKVRAARRAWFERWV